MMKQQNPNESAIGVPSRLCSVCGDTSTGIHFGGNSCESCKAFFRRSVQCSRFQNYKCSTEERCPVNIVTRKVCQFCRYAKCISIGMKPKWVLSDQEREEKYGARRKRFRENRTAEEDPEIYKHLTKEEKVLVEDIAHALYQSRATYPLNFPSPSVLFSSPNNASTESSNPSTPSSDKPPSASANLLIVPIQRLVLFARMLKDFDLFSEDDKVALLKGSAIEMMVCSSSTLFDPKTHTFSNYLSRDQRAVMDNQIMPLDPLLTRLWGEEVFNRTRDFLISMCNLRVDEVTSTLLAPVILFSPDRNNVKDLDLVKRLQVKYASVLKKYMNWRYGTETSDQIYPRLLLQIVNIRTLSLAHGEVIQRLMATSNVNPLVQEVTIKEEMLSKIPADRMDISSLSISSSPFDPNQMDLDKTPSNETESNNGSDDDEYSKRSSKQSADDDFDFDTDNYDESHPRNIWRKRRRVSPDRQKSSFSSGFMQTSNINSSGHSTTPTNINYSVPVTNQFQANNTMQNNDLFRFSNSDSIRSNKQAVPPVNQAGIYDSTRVSNSATMLNNDFRHPTNSVNSTMSLSNPLLNNQSSSIFQGSAPVSINEPDIINFDSISNSSVHLNTPPADRSFFCEQTQDPFQQMFSNTASGIEQNSRSIPSANNQSFNVPTTGFTNQYNMNLSHSSAPMTGGTTLNSEEQQLLNAIQAHPNKRDIVLSLLRQINEPVSSSSLTNHTHEIHQQYPQPVHFNNDQFYRDSSLMTQNSYQEYTNVNHQSRS